MREKLNIGCSLAADDSSFSLKFTASHANGVGYTNGEIDFGETFFGVSLPLSLSTLLVCRSIRSKYKIEARSFGEHSEVPIPREKGNASVDTALGDQCVAEARLAPFCQHFRP